MNRLEAIEYLKSKLKNKNLIKHNLAVEACMKRLAKEFGLSLEDFITISLGAMKEISGELGL